MAFMCFKGLGCGLQITETLWRELIRELEKGSDTTGVQIMHIHYASASVENTPEIESGPLHAEKPLGLKLVSEHKVAKLA